MALMLETIFQNGRDRNTALLEDRLQSHYGYQLSVPVKPVLPGREEEEACLNPTQWTYVSELLRPTSVVGEPITAASPVEGVIMSAVP